MRRILCLNGPNLDRLGTRDPDVYGTATLAELESNVGAWAAELSHRVDFMQSNRESDLIDAIHAAGRFDGIVINPGGLTHTSAALADALDACPTPAVEVHLSNVRHRHRWRRRSFVAPVAVRSIFGRGVRGYKDAIVHLDRRRRWPIETIRYGPHPDHEYDLRRGADPDTVALLVHGGFWMDCWSGDTVEGWAIDLAERGVTTCVVEYRRLGSGGGHPATAADVADAAQSVLASLAPRRHIVIGHSAGAQLMVGASRSWHPPPDLAIGVAGIYDLESACREGLGEGAVEPFLAAGGESPMTHPPPPCPLVLVHGAADMTVPPDQSIRYRAHLEQSKGRVDLVTIAGEDHFHPLDPASSAWQAVVENVNRVRA